jgi:hypothetical protein
MRRLPGRTLLAAGLVFLLTLIVRFPAPWLKPLLPRGVACGGLSGTLWAGECLGLQVNGTPTGDLDWTLRGLPLLRAELAGAFALDQPGEVVTTGFSITPSGTLRLRDLHADLVLSRPLALPQLPRLAGGRIEANLSQLVYGQHRLRALRGRIDALDLLDPGAPPTPLGSYQLRFDAPPEANGDLVGLVHDLGGPIAFDGTLRLTPAPGFRLEGRVAARADADPAIVRTLEFLGAAGADGRRPLTEEGTF